MNLDLSTITLQVGGHATRESGVCLMEAVAWFAGELHTDRPACVSPVLTSYGMRLNDVLPDGQRGELRHLVPLLPGTAGDGHDQWREFLAMDWLIRTTYLPVWLSLAGLNQTASRLHALDPITRLESLQAALPIVHAAGAAARAAARTAVGVAAGAAAGAAARTAAGTAAWDTAGAAAEAAAWDSAGAVVGDTVGDIAWDAAGVVIGAAARAAAWDAVGDAAGVAAWNTAWNAAWNAAGALLAPTIAGLHRSAIALFQKMISGERP